MDDRHRNLDAAPWKYQCVITMLDGMSTTTATPDLTVTAPSADGPTVFHPTPGLVRRAIERRSVATLATVSASGRPHAATVLYQCVDDALYVSTHRDSRKAREALGQCGPLSELDRTLGFFA